MNATQMQCSQIVAEAMANIGDRFHVVNDDSGCVVTTPFLYADAAPVELRITLTTDGSVLLSDDGETVNQLFVSGVSIYSSEVRQAIRLAASIQSVSLEDEALELRVPVSDIGEAVNRLCAAAQAVSFLIYKRGHGGKLKFSSEVQRLLISNKIQYEINRHISGSGKTHTIPLTIDNSSRPMLISPISVRTLAAARESAVRIGFRWADIKRKHGDGSYFCVSVLNDDDQKYSDLWKDEDVVTPLTVYSDRVIRWHAEQSQLVTLASSMS